MYQNKNFNFSSVSREMLCFGILNKLSVTSNMIILSFFHNFFGQKKGEGRKLARLTLKLHQKFFGYHSDVYQSLKYAFDHLLWNAHQ